MVLRVKERFNYQDGEQGPALYVRYKEGHRGKEWVAECEAVKKTPETEKLREDLITTSSRKAKRAS